MKKIFAVILVLGFCFLSSPVFAGMNEMLNKIKTVAGDKLPAASSVKLSDTKIGQGLKEALKVGIEKAVTAAGKADGYQKNDAIKILLPESLKNFDKILRTAGFGTQLDEFTLSMNRAAEKAAPLAKDVFLNAIFDLSFDDVQKIYSGGNTAATDYLKAKTQDKLLSTFRPVIQKSMDEFAVSQKYNSIVKSAKSLPFTKNLAIQDADQYVVTKALDGLFLLLGQEEAKIRQDPGARATDLLKEVFKK